jgi:anti-sigma factor RsiW
MTSTTHAVAPEDIMAFLDGELPAFEAQTVSAHLKECAQCAMVAEQFRATSQMLSRWDVPGFSVELGDSVRSLAAKAATGTGPRSQCAGFRFYKNL